MKNEKVQYLVRLALLAAILGVLYGTGLGFLPVTPLFTLTILSVPVVIGALILGPGAGAVLGALFGLSSFINACRGQSGVLMTDLLTLAPILTFVLCVVPRLLMGWLCGLVYKGAKRTIGDNIFSVTIAGFSGPILNTLLFVSMLMLLFGNSTPMLTRRGGTDVFSYLVAFVGINGVIEAVVCGILGTIISKALFVFLKKQK